MKNYMLKGVLSLSLLVAFASCSKEDSLSDVSVLPDNNVVKSELDLYLDKTFGIPYGIDIIYKWDRNYYGESRDVLRNLYPAQEENVRPALEMVDLVWIQTYNEAAGEDFIKNIRPLEFVLAGGPAINEDGTRTLGLASSGVRITLYELNSVVANKAAAQQYIHTIQHEYIHIINQNTEFIEKDFGKMTMADYTPNWSEVRPQDAIEAGFVTPYASNNIFEDFAETASYLMSNTKEQYEALLESYKVPNSNPVTYRPGRAKLMYKVDFIRNYFKQEFDVDFDLLCEVANRNAASSPLLNRPTTLVGKSTAIGPDSFYGIITSEKGEKQVRYCQHDLYWASRSIK